MKTTKETATVNYLGFDFDLEGNYTPEENSTYDYPSSSSEFEITSVTLNGIDAELLINCLSSKLDAWDELAALAIEKIIN
jgi:hypothetical protein